jgi:hypothetical protein
LYHNIVVNANWRDARLTRKVITIEELRDKAAQHGYKIEVIKNKGRILYGLFDIVGTFDLDGVECTNLQITKSGKEIKPSRLPVRNLTTPTKSTHWL